MLKQHLKRSKSGKGKAILRHSCLQQKSPVIAGQPTLRNASKFIQNGNRASADSSETGESDKNEYENDTIDSEAEDESCDANDRPNATYSGRTITRRSEIDFSFS